MKDRPIWIGIDPLSDELQCSKRTIYDLKTDNVLRAGVHYYAVGKGTARHVYNLDLCRDALLEETAKRAELEAKKIQATETYNESHRKELVAGGRI